MDTRIENRTKSMYNNGLIAETQRLIDLNCSTNNTALQALGYKECYEYLTGVCTLEEALERTIIGTRQYAKRQMTWFRLQCPAQWISWPDSEKFEEMVNKSLHLLRNSGNNIV